MTANYVTANRLFGSKSLMIFLVSKFRVKNFSIKQEDMEILEIFFFVCSREVQGSWWLVLHLKMFTSHFLKHG